MKKNTSIILITFFLCLNYMSAQDYIPFPDENTTWIDGVFFTGYYPPIDTIYSFFNTSDKVSLNDTLYTTIEKYDNDYCFIREKDKKVFCRYNEDFPEFVLYDFDLNAGDTVLVPFTMEYSFNYFEGTVEHVDSLLVGNRYHKRFHIQAGDWNHFKFIEGIGSEQGLMYCELEYFDWYGDLVCFSRNDTVFNTNGSGSYSQGQCSIYVNTDEVINQNLKLYPNPTNDLLIIDGNFEYYFELINITGEKLLCGNSSCLSLKQYPDGLYLINVYTRDMELTKSSKIIKSSFR